MPHVSVVCGPMSHGTHVEIKGQLCEIGSLLPPLHRLQGSNPGHQTQGQVSLPTEPSHQVTHHCPDDPFARAQSCDSTPCLLSFILSSVCTFYHASTILKKNACCPTTDLL